MRAILFVLCVVLLASGCMQTVRQGASGALGVGKTVKPEYAGAIEQIQRLIAGKPVNPVEGFEFTTIWRYDGQIIDAANLTREDRFWRVQTANEAGVVSVVRPASEISDHDQALRDQIERILNAAGVTDE